MLRGDCLIYLTPQSLMSYYYPRPPLAYVASVSLWFRSRERPRNEIFSFGRAYNGIALLRSPFFARSLTLAPRSLLRNRMETLATQATPPPLQSLYLFVSIQWGRGERRNGFIRRRVYRSFSLSRNKKINWKPSSGRSQDNEKL